MKQPHLGKKISELRLSKGLTQTELAEKCNLNLRTIQRIELAEVTPRSHSLKLIFKNLDYDNYKPQHKSVTTLFNLKTNTLLIGVVLLLILCIALFGYFNSSFSNKKQSALEVSKIINTSQTNIQKWMNNSQIDSVLTIYRKDACTLHSICGKSGIREMLESAINNGYELMEYNTISISVSDTIAVEKYKSTYKFKGTLRSQVGITEWRLSNNKWLIVNDVFHEN
jgi:transcriptional regulator with XRE-family HTH domain